MKKVLAIFIFFLTSISYGQGTIIDSLIESSNLKANNGKLDEALADLNYAIELGPDNPQAYCARGLLMVSGFADFESGYEDFSKSINIEPDEGELYLLRALTAKELRDYSKAYNDFVKSFELMPDLGYQYYAISYIVENINSTLSMSNQESYTLTLSGIKQIESGQYQKSLEFFNKAIKIDTVYYFAYASRGMAYQMLEKNNKAIKDYEKALQLNNFCDLALFGLGEIQTSTGQYSLAILSFTKLLLYKPDNAIAMTGLGMAWYKTGQTMQACELWSKAKQLGDRKAVEYIIQYCE